MFAYTTACELTSNQITDERTAVKAIPALFEQPDKGTCIEANASLKGTMEITGDDCVVILGTFEGLIIAREGKVFIGAGGVVRGSIEAAQIVVVGTIDSTSGDDCIVANEILAISENGQVTSPTIGYGSITMELGAVLQGSLKPAATRATGGRQEPPVPTASTPRPPAAPVANPGRVIDIDPRRPPVASKSPEPAATAPMESRPITAATATDQVQLRAKETDAATNLSAAAPQAEKAELPALRTGTDDSLTPLGG